VQPEQFGGQQGQFSHSNIPPRTRFHAAGFTRTWLTPNRTAICFTA